MANPFGGVKPRRGGVSFSGGGGGNRGLFALQNYMVAQKKGQGFQGGLGEAVPAGGVDPSTGLRFETQSGQNFDVAGKLREQASKDALKLQESLPILDDLERSYIEAYQSMKGSRSGISGGANALGEFGSGVVGRQNDALRRFIDKARQYEAPLIRLTGDVGNFSESDRKSVSAGIPQAGPNLDPRKMFLPDDPQYGLSKIQSLKGMFSKKFEEALHVAKTGQLTEGYANWANQGSKNSPIPGMNQQIQQSNPSQSLEDELRRLYTTGK